MSEFTFKEMIIQGWPVLSILFIASIVVYAVVHAQEEKKVQVPTVYLTLIQNIPKFCPVQSSRAC